MVSATSVERPEAMSCAPSGATPIVSTTPSGGERSCPLPVRGDPSWRESPMESRRGEKSGQRTILGPARTGFFNRRTLSMRTLSRTPLPRREEPDINKLCPQSTFQELPVMGKEYASLDRSWPPVLGSGVRHVLEESFLNFSRVTEWFS